MRRLALAVLLLLGTAAAALAQNNSARQSSNFITPLGYCQFTASGSATTFAAATPTSTTTCTPPALTAWVTICIETAAIRWRDDGTAPTTSVGMPVSAGQCFYYNSDLSKLKIIAQTGSPVVDASFYDGPGLQ